MLNLVKSYMCSSHTEDMYAAYKKEPYALGDLRRMPEHPACLLFPDLQGDGVFHAVACPQGQYDIARFFPMGVRPMAACAIPTEPSDIGMGRSGEYRLCPGDVLFLETYEILWEWFKVDSGNVLILIRRE